MNASEAAQAIKPESVTLGRAIKLAREIADSVSCGYRLDNTQLAIARRVFKIAEEKFVEIKPIAGVTKTVKSTGK